MPLCLPNVILQAAEEALNVLTKKDMAELKAYAKPPEKVELTLSGECTLMYTRRVLHTCTSLMTATMPITYLITGSLSHNAAVMTVLRRPPTWDEAKKQLGDPSFMTKLLEFDKDKLDDALLKKVGKFTQVSLLSAVFLSGHALMLLCFLSTA